MSESERIELADYIRISKKEEGLKSGKLLKLEITGAISPVREVIVTGGRK